MYTLFPMTNIFLLILYKDSHFLRFGESLFYFTMVLPESVAVLDLLIKYAQSILINHTLILMFRFNPERYLMAHHLCYHFLCVCSHSLIN